MTRSLRWTAYAFAGLLLVWCATTAFAQDTGSQGQAPAGGQTMRHGQGGNRLDWLSKQLDLTDDQKTKLKPILDDESKQMKTVHEDTSLSQDQKRDKMKEIRATTNSKIEDILTPDQQKKFKELNAEGREHHGKTTNPPSGSTPPSQ